jgi:hypothetical protein
MRRLDSPQLAAEVKAEPDAVATEIEELEVRMGELASAYGEGRVTMGEWLKARDPLEAQLASARAKRDEAAGLTVLNDYREAGVLRASWGTLSVDRQRAILSAVISRVVIAPAEKRARFDPNRISIEWRF